MARQKKLEEAELIDDVETNELDEAADSNPTEGMDDYSRSNILSVAMKKLSLLPKSDLIEFFNKSINSIGSESSVIPSGAAEKNKASIAMKGAVKEDLETIFGDNQTLSEEFKEKAETLFEAAVSSRLALIEAELEEAYQAELDEHIEQITLQLIESVDQYVSRIADDWLESNQVEVEQSLRNEITEDLIEDLRAVFLEHNINVPEAEVDAVDMLSTKVNELEQTLNDTINENIELVEHVKQLEKTRLVSEASAAMTEIDRERLVGLTEDIDYDDQFESKLVTILESYFDESSPTYKNSDTQLINEEIGYNNDEAPDGSSSDSDPTVIEYARRLKATVARA